MNRLTAQKIAFQFVDSLVILGAIVAQFTVRRSERLWAVVQDQARVDWWLLRDRLMFDALSFALAAVQEIEYIADDIYVEAAEIIKALFLLPQAFYYIQQLDHEIPVDLEAPIKSRGLVKPAIAAPQIAGLLPPASTPEFVPVISSPAAVELPADWDRDRNGRRLAGAALQARMRKYQLSAV